jgi:hypothetical protein
LDLDERRFQETRKLSISRSEEFVEDAIKIAQAAKDEGIVLRVLGACAVRIHSDKSKHMLDEMQRFISDLDFMSYEKFEPKITPLFTKLGYKADSDVTKYYAHMYGLLRDRFKDPNANSTLDVFYDKLEMSHTIDLSKRLEVDFPTISVSDILLEKMQIVKINQKDVQDTLVLLSEHPISDSDHDSVNAKYISQVLSEDWGFYYTVTTNLRRLQEYAASPPVLAASADSVKKKINDLIQAIEARPKGMKWKMRARIGTRQKWYNDVDEVSMGPTVGAK